MRAWRRPAIRRRARAGPGRSSPLQRQPPQTPLRNYSETRLLSRGRRGESSRARASSAAARKGQSANDDPRERERESARGTQTRATRGSNSRRILRAHSRASSEGAAARPLKTCVRHSHVIRTTRGGGKGPFERESALQGDKDAAVGLPGEPSSSSSDSWLACAAPPLPWASREQTALRVPPKRDHRVMRKLIFTRWRAGDRGELHPRRKQKSALPRDSLVP